MIIGNNNNNNFNNDNMNFQNKFNTIKEENKKNNININSYSNDHTNKYTNVYDKNEMIEKSFTILQERLNNGTITLDEFNKQCNKLNKLRK